MKTKLTKKLAGSIINSLGSGVVPIEGLEFMSMGRKKERSILNESLKNIAGGDASFRIVAGPYGSGKTTLLHLLKERSSAKNFVVATSDLSPDTRLAGTDGQALKLYQNLIASLSRGGSKIDGELCFILDHWLGLLQLNLFRKKIKNESKQANWKTLEKYISGKLKSLEKLPYAYDFIRVLKHYFKASYWKDAEGKEESLYWLYANKLSGTAKRTLNLSTNIDDSNWFAILKLWAATFSIMGYAGFVILIDEAVNLFKITKSDTRNKNYETLLAIFNDCMQGRAKYLGFFLGATDECLDNTKRGFYSYDALRTRLKPSRFADSNSFSSPVLELKSPSKVDLISMLVAAQDIYSIYRGKEIKMNAEQLKLFINSTFSSIGAAEFLTPRDVLRDFISILELMNSSKDIDIKLFLGVEDVLPASAGSTSSLLNKSHSSVRKNLHQSLRSNLQKKLNSRRKLSMQTGSCNSLPSSKKNRSSERLIASGGSRLSELVCKANNNAGEKYYAEIEF